MPPIRLRPGEYWEHQKMRWEEKNHLNKSPGAHTGVDLFKIQFAARIPAEFFDNKRIQIKQWSTRNKHESIQISPISF